MYSEDLADRVRNELAAMPFTEVKMFGGLCFLVGGNMACGVMKDGLMVRTGPDRHAEALRQPYARPMDFTGRPMRGFVIVDPGGLDDGSLRGWVWLGAEFASSLPPKRK